MSRRARLIIVISGGLVLWAVVFTLAVVVARLLTAA